ncbi:MAG: hypothetical protein ACLQDY_29525 [Streptosporangiaceae bacterium]
MTADASLNRTVPTASDRAGLGYRDALLGSPAAADAETTAASAVHSCWLCGARQPASRMVADGGAACADLRWYCMDARACTERWTARPADQRQGSISPAERRGIRLAGPDVSQAAAL